MAESLAGTSRSGVFIKREASQMSVGMDRTQGESKARSQLRHMPSQGTPGSQEEPSETFRILLASDCHLGYSDRDEIRRMDSIRTFEEVLMKAKEQDADFILLGGDLFHENKPSRFTSQHCAALLRKYCMGDKKMNFHLVSDPKVNFSHMEKALRRLNTDDPDLNIALPVFSIHGNHDDPTGMRYLSELDLLHTYGLINYFGKVKDIDNVQINPILLTKGRTKLALYGLGSIRDERLHRSFMNNRVKFMYPPDLNDWFHLFVLHQNRPTVRGKTNYIPEQFLDKNLDLVIWGHEHDPIIEPILNEAQGFEVLQPGSTVATSMSDGEGKLKHCYLLEVCDTQYRCTPIPLETTRPFFIEDVSLPDAGVIKTDLNTDTIRMEVEKFLDRKVERIIRRAELQQGPKQPKEPLIRLRVDFGSIDPLNPIVYGQKYLGRVANPRDMILQVKPKTIMLSGGRKILQPAKPIMLDTTTIEELVSDYFDKKKETMIVCNARLFTETLQLFVHGGEDKAVFNEVYDFQKKEMEKYLCGQDHIPTDSASLTQAALEYHENHKDTTRYVKEFNIWRRKDIPVASRGRRGGASRARGGKPTTPRGKSAVVSDDDDVTELDTGIKSTKRGRGRGAATVGTPTRGRAAAAAGNSTRGRGPTRSRRNVKYEESSEEEVITVSSEEEEAAPKSRRVRVNRTINDYFGSA